MRGLPSGETLRPFPRPPGCIMDVDGHEFPGTAAAPGRSGGCRHRLAVILSRLIVDHRCCSGAIALLPALVAALVLASVAACGGEVEPSLAASADGGCGGLSTSLLVCEERVGCAPVYVGVTSGPVECSARCASDNDCSSGSRCVSALQWDSVDPNNQEGSLRTANVCRP